MVLKDGVTALRLGQEATLLGVVERSPRVRARPRRRRMASSEPTNLGPPEA